VPLQEFEHAPVEGVGLTHIALHQPRQVARDANGAVVTDQSRKLVLTVATDGTVVAKPVEIGALSDGLRIITSGLAADDRVVVNGIMLARPGAKVTPQPGNISVVPRD